MSLRSKSPDDNSSLLSTSSLDSALNHSREEDELKALTCNDHQNDEITLREDIDRFFEQSELQNQAQSKPIFYNFLLIEFLLLSRLLILI